MFTNSVNRYQTEQSPLSWHLLSSLLLYLVNSTDDLRTVDPHLRLIILLRLHSTLHLSLTPQLSTSFPPEDHDSLVRFTAKRVCSTIFMKFTMCHPPAPLHRALNLSESTRVHINPAWLMSGRRPFL